MLMSITPSQPLISIMFVGLSIVTLFIFGKANHQLLDYLGFHLPLMYSDFVGFCNFQIVLLQRSLFMAIGLAGGFFAVMRLPRPSQSKLFRYASYLLSAALLAIAVFVGVNYLKHYQNISHNRTFYRSLNKRFKSMSRLQITTCDLKVSYSDGTIEATSDLACINSTNELIDDIVFSLNPGFRITNIRLDDTPIDFHREGHLVLFTPSKPISPEQTVSISFNYSGIVTDEMCYLKVDEKSWFKPLHIFFYSFKKQYAFQKHNFVLLTPESIWYPIPGLPASAYFPDQIRKDFIHFDLSVETESHLTAISQGDVNKTPGDANRVLYDFRMESHLPSVSLIIGEYEQQTVQVDSCKFSLFNHNGHNYYKRYFSLQAEDYEQILRDEMNDIEITLGMDYPFRNLSIIEVPIQFSPHEQLWTSATDLFQPELVLIPEYGVNMAESDFKRSRQKVENQINNAQLVLTDQEIQTRQFKLFINTNFNHYLTTQQTVGHFGFEIPSYSIGSQFYTHVNHIISSDWPVIDQAIEAYILSFLYDKTMGTDYSVGGFEYTNLGLDRYSLQEVLNDSTWTPFNLDIIKKKSEMLIKTIELKSESIGMDGYLFAESQRTRNP
jgi:hypothetical protein